MKKLIFINIALALALPPLASANDISRKECKVVVVAVIKVKSGFEEAFKRNALSILKPTRKEAGNISYIFNQSTTDKTLFTTYEQWNQLTDLEQHLNTRHMIAFFSRVSPSLEDGYPVIHTLKNIECPNENRVFVQNISEPEERLICPASAPCWSRDYPRCAPAIGGSCSP